MAKKMFDIIIGGGGYVGLSTAVAIKRSAPHMKIVLVDATPKQFVGKDERASAIAAAARRMLDQLGVWQQIEPETQPINEMIVTDSKVSDPVRPVFLTFGNVEENSEEPFAHMVPNKVMNGALRAAAEKNGVQFYQGVTVDGFDMEPAHVAVRLGNGDVLNGKLLVAADGVNSRLREQAGIKTVHWPYDQKGIVTTVKHERDHEGRAEEHFLPAGPFAILPLKGNRSSLVWTETTKEADRLLAADELTFEFELEQRFGHKLGEISVETKPVAYPLGLRLARSFITERVALAGDAAHGIHPIAGQGLNLGFKDVAALAETVVEADRLGLDIGSEAVLERYQMWRRFDTVQMGVVTDVLNRLFSNDFQPLRLARTFGLGIVERLPGLKKQFIGEASGFGGALPKLLRGEAI